MSYRDMFNGDSEYQGIISTFNRKKARLEEMAKQGLYRKSHLQEIAAKLQTELQQNIEQYNRAKLESLQAAQEALENKNKRVGYADRPDDVRELEMRFKLASKSELQDMVQDLNTNDLLEVNLLRSELKNRNLDELDSRVHRYSAMNLEGFGGMDDESKKQHESIGEQIGVFATMGNRYLVVGEELLPVDQIGKNLMQAASATVNDKSVVRDVDIATF